MSARKSRPPCKNNCGKPCNRNTIFCSIACFHEWRRKQGLDHSKRYSPTIRKCENCKQPCKFHTTFFCSIICFRQWRKKNGFGHSVSTRQRQRAKLKGKPHSPAHNRKVSEAKKGKPQMRPVLPGSESAKKISLANKGKKRTAEQRDKFSKAQRKRFALEKEQGIVRTQSEESNQKRSESLRAFCLSEDGRERKRLAAYKAWETRRATRSI